MSHAVAQAVRLLRNAAHENRGLGWYSSSLKEAADALAAYFADPPADEVERLARAYWENPNNGMLWIPLKEDLPAMANDVCDGIRAVLKAIGESE